MSDLKRYKLYNTTCGADSSKELIVDENGDYVKFSDYEELKAEVEELKAQLDLIRKVAIHNNDGNSIIPSDIL